MTNGKKRFKMRKKKSEEWKMWFKSKFGRDPTDIEGKIFGQGFNIGWKQGKIRENLLKEINKEKSEELNNRVENE